MTKYREILRLTVLGLSQRNIMQSINVSQKNVVKVQRRAREMNLSWPLDESLTDIELGKLMFPKESKQAPKKMPDFNFRSELLFKVIADRSERGSTIVTTNLAFSEWMNIPVRQNRPSGVA